MNKIAIIGGTGVYDANLLNHAESHTILTPFGEVNYLSGTYNDKEVVFITRHGKKHSIPPHKINYRANIWGLKALGVQSIIATTAVGSLNLNMKPGEMVTPTQFLDFTHSRIGTFFDGELFPVAHVDMTEPYCPVLRNLIKIAAEKSNIPLHPSGVYVCTEGPRFETVAEIKMFAKMDGDLVGMTNVPECQLAREAEMAYATISMVTNYAAGISQHPLTHAEVVEAMDKNKKQLQLLIKNILDEYRFDMKSPAFEAMSEYGGFKIK